MRSLLFLRGFLLGLQLMVCAAGCIDSQQTQNPHLPPLPEQRDEGAQISVAVPQGIWQKAVTKLDQNSITFEKAVVFAEKEDGVSLVLSAGTRCRFAAKDGGVVLGFSDPYPVAKKSIGHAKIASIILFPDGTGAAQTLNFGTWKIRWDDPKEQEIGSTGAACSCGCKKEGCTCSTDGPQVAASKATTRHAEYYTASWCGPCRTFGPRLKALGDKHGLKIRTIDIDQNPAAWQPHALKDNQIPQVVFFDGDKFLEAIVQPTDEQILKAMGVSK